MSLDEETRQVIAGAVAEIDREQIAVTRGLSVAQRAQQAFSMIALAERVGAYRLRLRRPELSEREALQIVRGRG